MSKPKIVAVSGYFDPLHVGHLEMIEKAKELGDFLVVIVNNDEQAKLKKGASFMSQDDRIKIISSLKYVDKVVLSIDKDKSICETLRMIQPDIFANGGDRHQGEVPETKVCRELNIEMVDELGAKIRASSEILKKIKEHKAQKTLNKHIFRMYDIRGIVDVDLNPEILETLGKGIGTYFNKNRVLVARDNRLTSKDYKNALIKGLISTGSDIIDLGEIPVSIFYYATKLLNIDNGVMITASHNPKEYNGIKIIKDGRSVYGNMIQDIRKICEDKTFLEGTGKIEEKDIVNEYFNMLKEKIKLNKKLKVVVDCGNGTVSDFAPKILRNLGCKVVELYCESDGNFPNHHPDPTKPEEYKALMQKVIAENADLGLAFDGDGDRIGIIDEKGNMIFGDTLISLFSKEILEKNPESKILVEVKCSQGTIDYIQSNGGVVLMSPTGHSLIENMMHKENALLAGEMSGHIYFNDEFFGFDDAIYVSLRLLRLLSNSEKKLSNILEELPKYHSTPELRLKCNEEDKFKIIKEISDFFKTKYDSIDIDGIRILFENGWAGLRASNTEPAISVRCEGKTPEDLEIIKEIVREKLEEYPNLKLNF